MRASRLNKVEAAGEPRIYQKQQVRELLCSKTSQIEKKVGSMSKSRGSGWI
jgi:hypothetical protein